MCKQPIKAKTLDEARRYARNYCINNTVWDEIVLFCNDRPSGMVIPSHEMYPSRGGPVKEFFKARDGTKRGMGEFVTKVYWHPMCKPNTKYLINPDGSVSKN